MKIVGMSIAAVVLVLSSSCTAPTEQLGQDPGTGRQPTTEAVLRPSPACSVDRSGAYRYAGPGGDTPIEAAEFVSRGLDLSLRSREGRHAEVDAVDPDTGVLKTIFRVSKSSDLWKPDGFTTCAR